MDDNLDPKSLVIAGVVSTNQDVLHVSREISVSKGRDEGDRAAPWYDGNLVLEESPLTYQQAGGACTS